MIKSINIIKKFLNSKLIRTIKDPPSTTSTTKSNGKKVAITRLIDNNEIIRKCSHYPKLKTQLK